MSLRVIPRTIGGYSAAIYRRGRFTDDPLELSVEQVWGGYRICKKLLKSICRRASSITWQQTSAMFESRARAARYLGWERSYHPLDA